MSLFDPDEDDPASETSSPFVEAPDSESGVPEPENPGTTQLPPAGQDSSPYYVSAPEEAPPPEEQGPFGGEGGYSSPAEAPEQAPSDGQPADDNEWLKPIPVPPAVQFSPYKDSTADLDALKAQYAKEATENTKPSGWRRFAAGLAGGAVAFGSHNPAEGMNVADRINNAPRVAAEERWQREEKPLAQQLTTDQQQNAAIQRANALKQQQGTEADRQYRNQAYAQDQEGRARNFAAQAQARQNAPVSFSPDDPNNPYAGGTVKTASGQIVKGQPPPDKWIQAWTKSPQGQNAIEGMNVQGRAKIAQQNGLKPGTEQYNNFVYKTPMTTHTTISVREGGTPKPAMNEAQQRLILNTKNSAMAKAQDQLAQGLIKPEDAQAQMQVAQNNFEQQLGVDNNGPDHMVVGPDFSFSKAGAQRAAAPAQPQPAAQSAQPNGAQPQTFQYKGQTVTAGQKANVNGHVVTITGINPKTGKLIVQAQ